MMSMVGLHAYFIPGEASGLAAARHRLVLNASLCTAMFSFSYLILAFLVSFPEGMYLMIFDVVGFLSVPFLMKWRTPILLLANIYILIGSIAVLTVIFFSGGTASPVMPWLIAPPVLGLLIVNRFHSIAWAAISLAELTVMTVLENRGIKFPVHYDLNWSVSLGFLSMFGIILIVVVISMIFEGNLRNALSATAAKNEELEKSRQALETLYAEILEKNVALVIQKEEITVISDKLKKLNDKKDNLMYTITHDLKSPFASIQILTRLSARKVQSDLTDKQVIELIGTIADKSQVLIQKMLNADNFEQVVYNIKLEHLDVAHVLNGVIEGLRSVANQKNIAIVFASPPDGTTAWVDKIYLTQVFENLINNAVKFSPQNTQVQIALEGGEDLLRAIIKDQGPGIKDEEKDLLFKRFLPLSNRPTGGESSTGLGLSIVKHYVELLNGDVRCESQHGHGCSFIVELPRHQ